MTSLANKTILITGATRGIGKAIALRAAQDGANIVVLGKTGQPHAKLEGTVFSSAKAMEAAGGRSLACVTDIRFEDQVTAAVDLAVETFGGIDIVVNNASAIQLTGTLNTEMKRFDLMHSVNVRGTFLVSRLCLPHLLKADNPHILNIAPPLNMEPHWFGPHVAYSMSKYGMSMCVLGMAEEFREQGIGINGLWPRTGIATAAIRNLLGGDDAVRTCRKPEIVADAAHSILIRRGSDCTGNFFIDDEVLQADGVSDFTSYEVDPTAQPKMPDFFV